MSLLLETPTKLRITGHDREDLARLLTYRDLTVDWELQQFKRKSFWHKRQLGVDGYNARLEELKSLQKKCLLYEDEKGLWTFSGFYDLLANHLGERAERLFPSPVGRPLQTLEDMKTPRPYQLEGNAKLFEARHGCVEVGTGLGKSFMAQMLTQHLGQQAVIQAPSVSIAEQLLEDFERVFGRRMVGMFGDGKKDFGKLITIAIAASLSKLEPGMPAYEKLKQARVFMGDEAHLLPAKTLAKVCFGLMADVPWRFFFTGTHMRGDGADKLLEGITGPVVFRMSVREGVDQGYLAKPQFRVVNVHSDKNYYNRDADKMTRAHLYYNDAVVKAAADIANGSVGMLKQNVLILIEEFEQFQRLVPYLRYKVGFAHGTVTKEQEAYVPEAHRKTDNKALVEAFNRRELPILVGTSCISTGTDIHTADNVIFLRGGKSEVQVRQAIGRGTRLLPGTGKQGFNFTDFRVHVDCMPTDEQGQQMMSVVERHLEDRMDIYEDVYPGVIKEVKYGN